MRGRRVTPRWRLFLLVAGLGFALSPPSVRAADFLASSFRLKNGLQVLVIPDHRAPIVTQMVWYRIGAADEPPGKSGIAHVLEHLMFKGTAKVPAGAFSKIVARNGGRDNAFTDQDYTAYFQNVAADRLELVMKLEADRMANLALTQEVFAPELKVVIEERRMRTDNQPLAQLLEQMQAEQYLVHPYRIPVIGWMYELRRLTLADAQDVYRRYYAPGNAILVIAGDVTVKRVRRLAEKYYGGVPARPTPPRVRPKEPRQIAARRVILTDAKVRQSRMVRTYLAPSMVAGRTGDAVPLQVLAEIIGGGTTSRLYQDLVVKRKIAAAAGAFYDPDAVDKTTFGIYAIPKPGTPSKAADLAHQVETAADAVIARVMVAGVDADELARAKEGLVAAAVYARDSAFGMANVYGRALAVGETVEDVATWPDRVRAVTAADVRRAARDLFDIARSVTGVLLPEVAAPAAGN